MTKQLTKKAPEKMSGPADEKRFFADVARMLKEGREKTGAVINFVMVETYWNIGRRVVEQEQKGKERAEYGDSLITHLSRYLTDELGKGFSEANLWNMRQFYQIFPDFSQFSTHCVGNLSWTNIRAIMRLDSEKERNYYLKEASLGNWSSRVLERNIKSGYYRRVLSTQEKGRARKTPALETPSVADFIKDPYVLEFLNIPEDLRDNESTLESAIISHLQKFLLEMGKGFSFVGRQLRMSTETEHFYADLVFYNYLLKCFIIVDLKTARLTHQDIGQMDMYVRMFDALKRGEDDNPTIGIILCSGKSEAMAKYSILKESKQLFAAKYMSVLPTEEELAAELERNARYLREARA